MSEAFGISEGGAYAVLYTVLSASSVLAVIAAGHCGRLKILFRMGCIMKPVMPNKEGDDRGNSGGYDSAHTADFFLAARNSASSRAIALGMGAWVVYGSTAMGANSNLSWFGVLGYSGASALPVIILCLLGPAGHHRQEGVRDHRLRVGQIRTVDAAFDRGNQLWIYLVSEMTSISNVYGLMVGLDTFSDTTIKYTTSIAVSLVVFTWFYTSITGLPASIVTDKFQAGLMFSLVLILLIVACSNSDNHVTREEFGATSNWTTDGLTAAITLFIAIACAELFNQGTWQRLWAAKSIKDMMVGFCLGSFLVFLLMMFFGIMGMLSYANDPTAYDNFEKFAYLAFFDLILPLNAAWHVVTLVIVTALAA
ncbi:LOW QUALITY PROTEIN: hypothetical protein ACHAWF_010221 [Thalassiosira exigua]